MNASSESGLCATLISCLVINEFVRTGCAVLVVNDDFDLPAKHTPPAGSDLRREGEIDAAFLSWPEGGIGAVWTQLEVARVGAREDYLADLQRGLAIIPQADSKRLAR